MCLAANGTLIQKKLSLKFSTALTEIILPHYMPLLNTSPEDSSFTASNGLFLHFFSGSVCVVCYPQCGTLGRITASLADTSVSS